MKAVIMAGGKGTRLRPLTCNTSKPMVPLLDRPCMEYMVDLLKLHGINDIAVTVQYLPQTIIRHFGDGSEFGVRMQIYEESVPLGTAGSVKNCEDFLDETFLVISGDGLTDFDLTEIIRFHKEKKAMVTIVMTKVDAPLEYGVVITEADGRITHFLEKPSWSEVFADTVNTGIYVIEPEVLQLFSKGQEFDFSKDLFPLMLASNMPIYGYTAEGYWSDIGNLQQYRQTQFDMLMGLVDVNIRGEEQLPRVWVGRDSTIAPGAVIAGPSFIGADVTIVSGANIGPYAVIGSHSHIESQVTMERSVMWAGSRILYAAMLKGATLCSKILLGKGAQVDEGAVIGDRVDLGDHSLVRPEVKIWPEKSIGEGVIQSTSLIWGNLVSHSLFDEDGISGLPSIELNPEMVGRIVASYGSNLKKGSFVSVSCDEFPYSPVLKLSAAASLMALNLNVRDHGIVPVPVARYGISTSDCIGGVHVRRVVEDGDKRIVIQFFDEYGLPIDKGLERKIENVFVQEDYIRPDPQTVGLLESSNEVTNQYVREVLEHINQDVIAARSYGVFLHCENITVQAILLSILHALSCEVITTTKKQIDMAQSVIANKVDFGISVDQSGQKFILYTDQGRALSADEILILQMFIAVKENTEVAVPVSAPSVIEELAQQLGASVVRTKAVKRSLLEVLRHHGLQFHFDAFYSLGSLLQFMAEEQLPLQAMVNQIPQFHMKTVIVPCPVNAKGRVMRKLVEDLKGMRPQLINGIRVMSEIGWALITPDEERGMFKVVVQGNTIDHAEELAELYKNKIISYQAWSF